MALADLRNLYENRDEDRAIDTDPPFDDGYIAPFFDLGEFVSWLFPIPAEQATLYYNPEVLRTPVCKARALADFRARHPGITPAMQPLSLNELRQVSICRYPLAERVFRQRGFVSGKL